MVFSEMLQKKTIHAAAECRNTFVYQRTCYSKFTNKTFLQRAKEQIQKRTTIPLTAKRVDDEINDGNNDGVPARKLLRSIALKLADGAKPKNPHVLLAVCIICSKK